MAKDYEVSNGIKQKEDGSYVMLCGAKEQPIKIINRVKSNQRKDGE